jgi:hypothetical protein
MKKLAAVCLLLAFAASSARATPVLMTFEGSVWTLTDLDGVASAAGIGLGSVVSYTILVDFDGDAFVRTDGVDEIQPDEVDGAYAWERFYAEYLFGDHVASDTVGNQVSPYQTSFVGQNETLLETGEVSGEIYVGNVLTFGADSVVQSWDVGTVVYARDWWANGADAGHIASWATLTNLVMIPEPATAALVALGLLALAARSRLTGSRPTR